MSAADWSPRRLADFLDRNAAERGDAEALVTEGARLTHAALRAEVRVAARALLALGVRKGEHVGLLTGNDAHWVTLFYAAALIGAVTVPVNTRFKAAEIAFALRQADCRAVFVRDRFLKIDFAAMLREAEPAVETGLPGAALPLLRRAVVIGEDVPAGALSWEAFLAGATAVDDAALAAATEAVRADDPLLIQFTSGTTAYPKGVLLTHANMLRNASAAAARLGVRPDDRYLNCRPFFHVAGSTLSLLVCLVTGACLVTPPTFEAGAALRLLEDERCTVTSGNNSIFQMLMAHPEFRREKVHLRGGWAAAGPLTMRRIIEELGVRDLCWAYGLSEASPNVVLSDHREPPEDRIAGRAAPHPGVEVRIADPATGADSAAGSAGRDPGARLERDARLLQQPGSDREGVHRRWLAPHRRHRSAGRGGPAAHGRPAQGRAPRRRRERRAGRSRGGAARPSGRGNGAGGGHPGRPARGGSGRLRDAAPRRRGERAVHPRLVAPAAGQLPHAAAPARGGELRSDRHDRQRQGAENQAARTRDRIAGPSTGSAVVSRDSSPKSGSPLPSPASAVSSGNTEGLGADGRGGSCVARAAPSNTRPGRAA